LTRAVAVTAAALLFGGVAVARSPTPAPDRVPGGMMGGQPGEKTEPQERQRQMRHPM
jgi:hypothetical protein